MQSTLNRKPSDDPHDVVVVAPDAVRVAPSDDEISNLLQQAARQRSETQTRTAPDASADPTIPPVDTTFRPSVNDVPRSGSMARRAGRGFAALLLATCIGLSAVAWKSYGEVAKRKIAKVATQLVLTSELSSDDQARADEAAPPAVQADPANAASPQAAAQTQSAAETAAPAAAPSPESAQLLQSMARDLANLGQEVQLLKSGMEQLKASQQTSRDGAKVSDKPVEPSLRPRTSALPPRPAAARTRKPMAAYPPPPLQAAAAPYPPSSQAAAAPYPPPQATSPYVPRQPDPYGSQPQTASEQRLTDPELSSVPRPPMPVR
jgi:chemotaxis protein histidine kinase CheA